MKKFFVSIIMVLVPGIVGAQVTLPTLDEATTAGSNDLLLIRPDGATRDKKITKTNLLSGYSTIPSCDPPSGFVSPVNLLYLAPDGSLNCSGLWLDLDDNASTLISLDSSFGITAKDVITGGGAPVAGGTVSITAGAASSSLDTEGAAPGGPIIIRAGNANGYLTGTASGGYIQFIAGTGWNNGTSTAAEYISFLGGSFFFNNNEMIMDSASGKVYHVPNASGTFLLSGSDTTQTIGDATNYTQIDGDGTITLAGAATVWDDVVVPGYQLRTTGVAPADFAAWVGRPPMYIYHFEAAIDEEVFGSVQMPHAWAGTSVEFHVHWSPETASDGVPASQRVRWCIDYTWTNYGTTFGSSVTATCSATISPSEEPVANRHYITDIGTLNPGTTANNGSSILYFRLYRDADNAADNYEGEALLLSADIHTEFNKLGSNNVNPD